MEEHIVFEREFDKTRVLMIDGSPWFCLPDICRILALQTSIVVRGLKPDTVLIKDAPNERSKVQSEFFVNEEALLYRVIQTDCHAAKEYEEWIYMTVLPEIREKYGQPPAKDTSGMVKQSQGSELIPITENEGKRAVNARDLHAFLGSKQQFSDWIKNRIEKCDFVENQDYQVFHNFMNNPSGGRPQKEYALSIDMAKELSMVEGNEKGKQARKYFIACENKLKEVTRKVLPENYLDALKALVANEEEKQTLLLENMKLSDENQYRKEVIEGLIEDISLADMRQRIIQIIQKGGIHNIRSDWNRLYCEFDKKYHLNTTVRMNNRLFNGSRMDFIDKELNMIPELYELTCKLFESNYTKLMEDWGKFAKRVSRRQ